MKTNISTQFLRRAWRRITGRTVAGLAVLLLVSVAVWQNGRIRTPESIATPRSAAPETASFQEKRDSNFNSVEQDKGSVPPRPDTDEVASANQPSLGEAKTEDPPAQDQRPASEIALTESDGEELTAATLPLILIDLGDDIRFSEEGASIWTNMQQQFARAFSDGVQNSSTLEYYNRWQEAQTLFDERAQAMFGQDAYNAFSRRRAQVSSEPQ